MRLHLVGEGLNQILEMDWNRFVSVKWKSSFAHFVPHLMRGWGVTDTIARLNSLTSQMKFQEKELFADVLSQNDAHNALLKTGNGLVPDIGKHGKVAVSYT